MQFQVIQKIPTARSLSLSSAWFQLLFQGSRGRGDWFKDGRCRGALAFHIFCWSRGDGSSSSSSAGEIFSLLPFLFSSCFSFSLANHLIIYFFPACQSSHHVSLSYLPLSVDQTSGNLTNCILVPYRVSAFFFCLMPLLSELYKNLLPENLVCYFVIMKLKYHADGNLILLSCMYKLHCDSWNKPMCHEDSLISYY